MDTDEETKTNSKPQRSMCEKVVETGFLVATWLALVRLTLCHINMYKYLNMSYKILLYIFKKIRLICKQRAPAQNTN